MMHLGDSLNTNLVMMEPNYGLECKYWIFWGAPCIVVIIGLHDLRDPEEFRKGTWSSFRVGKVLELLLLFNVPVLWVEPHDDPVFIFHQGKPIININRGRAVGNPANIPACWGHLPGYLPWDDVLTESVEIQLVKAVPGNYLFVSFLWHK